jgi:hypothetical protein
MISWNWFFFLILVSSAYAGISYVGQLTATDSPSVFHTVLRLFKPSILLPMILATIAFNASLYFGFLATPVALTVAVSTGVIVSFTYSAVVMGTLVNALKLLGVSFILIGIFLLR